MKLCWDITHILKIPLIERRKIQVFSCSVNELNWEFSHQFLSSFQGKRMTFSSNSWGKTAFELNCKRTIVLIYLEVNTKNLYIRMLFYCLVQPLDSGSVLLAGVRCCSLCCQSTFPLPFAFRLFSLDNLMSGQQWTFSKLTRVTYSIMNFLILKTHSLQNALRCNFRSRKLICSFIKTSLKFHLKVFFPSYTFEFFRIVFSKAGVSHLGGNTIKLLPVLLLGWLS